MFSLPTRRGNLEAASVKLSDRSLTSKSNPVTQQPIAEALQGKASGGEIDFCAGRSVRFGCVCCVTSATNADSHKAEKEGHLHFGGFLIYLIFSTFSH